MTAKLLVRTVQDYLACGLAAILSRYGRADYDYVMDSVVIPGFTKVICTSTGDGRISEMAEEYRSLFREHPEAMEALIAMTISLGIGMATMEEIR